MADPCGEDSHMPVPTGGIVILTVCCFGDGSLRQLLPLLHPSHADESVNRNRTNFGGKRARYPVRHTEVR
jgi:hypothetical protein